MRIHCIKASNNKPTPMPSPWRSLDGFIWRLTEEREKRREAEAEAGGETQEAGGAPHWEEPGDFRLKGSGGDREEKIPGSGSICQIPVELHVLPSYCSPSLELYRLVVFIL